MKKLNKNENGFSAVELVLVLLIVILVAVVGWFVYRDRHKSTPVSTTSASATSNKSSLSTNASNSTTTTTPTSGTKETSADDKVQVTLPVGWNVVSRIDGGYGCGFAPTAPAPGTCVTEITFENGSSTSSQGYVKIFKTSDSASTWHQTTFGDGDCSSPQSETVAGNTELICTINPDPGGKDYTISSGSYVAYFTGDGSSDFLSIVGSVKFL